MNAKYWDRGWQIIDGCTPCSPGCDHCWAARLWHTYHKTTEEGHEEEWLTDCIINATGDLSDWRKVPKRIKFNGLIKTHPERFTIPLKRRKPIVYAVWNDLFHEKVPDEFIGDAFQSIFASQHTFLILTKRPQRMVKYLSGYYAGKFFDELFPNVYHGLTVCNQQEADEKIPVFLQVPGKKFLSLEPLLGPVDFRKVPGFNRIGMDLYGWNVLLGGETGPGARPMHPDWVRSVRDQCAAAGVPFFLKHLNKKDGRVLDGRTHDELPWRS